MKTLTHSLILAIVVLLGFSSCKNDLNLNAPYKEIPSIYAVLNPFEPVQVIRINKVFLGEGDANAMAKVADSVNYQPGDLTITMDRFLNGKQIDASPNHPDPAKRRTIVFKDSVVTASSGAFNTTQRVYVCYDNMLEVETPSTSSTPATYTVYGDYVLTVKNNKTGNVFTAKASALNQINPIQGYGPLSLPFYPYSPTETNGFINYSSPSPTNVVGSILFRPIDKAAIYKVVVRTLFYNDLGASGRSDDYVDYTFDDPKTIRTLSGIPFISISFRSNDYFSNMGVGLSKKNLPQALGRKAYLMEYFVYASTQEYLDYLQYATPSLSLNQNKPLYSNFDNQAALGIFTFRSSVKVQKQLDPVFVNAFSFNSYTCRYNFYDSNNNVISCK